MEQSAGTWAVLLAYVIPVVILVMALFILVSIHLDEGMAALISLALLVPYYLGLYFFRDRLKKSFKFKLKANQPI
jgi:sigma-E factor negative regulatory protein RseC